MKYELAYKPEDLYEGCVTMMAVHIAAVPTLLNIYYEKIWQGNRFSFIDISRCDGTFIFDENHILSAGAIRDSSSLRLDDYPNGNAEQYFTDADKKTQTFVHEQLMQFMLAEYQIPGNLFRKPKIVQVPAVTAGVWTENSVICTGENHSDFIENGGRVLDELCEKEPQRLNAFTESYELNEKELTFAKKLIQEKLTKTEPSVTRSFIIDTFGKGYKNADVLDELLEGFGIRII